MLNTLFRRRTSVLRRRTPDPGSLTNRDTVWTTRMPHLIVEYSSNVALHHDIDALLDVIHQIVLSHDFVPVAGVRIRGIEQAQTRVADGLDDNYAYIAMVARMGPGRDPDEKHQLIKSVLDAAGDQIDGEDGPLHIAWSFEVQEIDAEFRVNRNNIASHMKNTRTANGER